MSIRAKKFAEVFSNFLKNTPNEKNEISGSVNLFNTQTRLKYKKGETSYSKLSEIRYISLSLASSKTIRKWAEKTLPNGKILGLVTSADTLHYKTFKPLKGGLFCERIFGPLRDFECACGIQKRPTLEEYQKIVQHQPVERKFCSTCDVEYTWSIIRRYQLGYIELVTPVGHIWYSKGQPNYLSILLDWKKNDLDSFFYCTASSTLEESLQIFNNPFRVDPGFTNPLFDVDWIDFIKPNKLKTVSWSNSVLQESLKYKKLKNLQEQKRSILEPKHYKKLNCYFLKNKLHYFFTASSNSLAVDSLSLQKTNQTLESNLLYSRLYNILQKKAINLIYKAAYLYAHEKVTQKLFSCSSGSTLNSNLLTFLSAKEKNNMEYYPHLVSNLQEQRKTLCPMFNTKTDHEKFLCWFQMFLLRSSKQQSSQFFSSLTKNENKYMKTSHFSYKLFFKKLNQNSIVDVKDLYFAFNKVLLKNQKSLVFYSEKQKHYKFNFAKKIMPLAIVKTKETNYQNSKNLSLNQTLENVLKQILCSRLQEPEMFLLFQASLKPKYEIMLFRYFFNGNIRSKLNSIGKIYANFMFYDFLKLYFKYDYKKSCYINLLREQFEMLKSSSQFTKWVSKTDRMYNFRSLEQIKLLEKQLKFKDLFFLREKIRNKHLSTLISNFPFYKSNYTYNINYLLSNLHLNFIQTQNKTLSQDRVVLNQYNLSSLNTLNHLNLDKKENSRYFYWWFLLPFNSFKEKYDKSFVTKKLEDDSNLFESKNVNLTLEKEKQDNILSLFYSNISSSLNKTGIFYQQNTNIKNLQNLKLSQTIAKKSFYWKFGFFLSKNYFNSTNNNKIGKIPYNLNLIVTKMVQSIMISNQIKMTKIRKSRIVKKPFYTEKNYLNRSLRPTKRPTNVKTKQKVVQAYDSVIQNTSFLFYNPLNVIHSKDKFNQEMNMNIQIIGQNYKLMLLQTYFYNNRTPGIQNFNLDNFSSQLKNQSKMNEVLESWVTNKFFEYFINKRSFRFQYGFSAVIKNRERKAILRNSIYLLSSRERDFFYEEKRPVYLINYCRGYSNFDDIWLPIYQVKGLENPLITLTGASILQRFLQEFDDLKELSKMERQYRVELLAIEKRIREFKILGSFFMSMDERRKLEKFIKKQVYFLRKTKLIRKLFIKESKLSSTLLTTLPVLPPDLRPILKMQGQVAASDLNRLYQRVIYRNDRLKKLRKTSGCLPTDLKYAQRLLQEAVDNLIQNGKSGGSPEVDSRGRSLKSLSELLKGKQGRFRQNLLGKRVDYSGRSVIVVGPSLKIHECGLPKEIAVELFLPFLIQRILHYNLARTVIGAKSLIQSDPNLCSFLLAELMQSHPIYLNRAPTLHRLGIQAFQPKLVEGRAILLHPLVCPAFNADFDGDQIAVHLPLTVEARAEAWKLMLSRNHLISAGTGNPVMLPSQDMVLGCYYLTTDSLRPTTQTLFASSVSRTPQLVGLERLLKTLNFLINFNDFNNIAHFNFQKAEDQIITDQLPSSMNSKTAILKKIHNQISLMLKKARDQRFYNKDGIRFSRYFNNFEQVTKFYEHQKLKIHSDIWVNWKHSVETFSSKSRAGKIVPLEIQVHSDGSWNEIRYKHIRHFTNNHIQINQYIRTTPGRILFYNFIQNCIKD